MKLLADQRLYSQVEHCLRFLRSLDGEHEPGALREPERFHLYWYGPFSRKPAFTVKSFLATQHLGSAELWLWLDAENGHDGHEENPLLRPLLPFLQVRRLDLEAEARGTPIERRPDLFRGATPVLRSNLVRLLVLAGHGGTWVDADTMLLRDFRPLLQDERFAGEFCYRWSAHRPFANGAVLRMRAGSDVAHRLIERSVELGTSLSSRVFRLDASPPLDLLVLPCPFFDPLWPVVDGRHAYRAAPFRRFGDFFRRFSWRFRPKRGIRSYRDFFGGAFAYHWHNGWDAVEHDDSYFGRFNTEFDGILRNRLGIEESRPANHS